MGYSWLKTACQSSMLSKNSSLVNFTILHSNYLVAERHKVNGVSIVFTAGPVLHICARTLLYMVHWGARVRVMTHVLCFLPAKLLGLSWISGKR